MTLGAGLVLTGCGDDETATTPAPAPPPPPPPAPEPEPEPEPEAPATPTGFHVDTTQTSLTWHWNAVEGAIGYAVQVSTDEMFDDTDTITPTVETSFTVADLPPQTTLYARVAAAAGTLEAPVLSSWTTHVTGTTDMPPPPPPPPNAPATPTGLMAESGEGSITWSWDAVEGALAYVVQVSDDEMFDDTDTVMFDGLPVTTETSYTAMDLEPSTTLYARVAAAAGTPDAPLMSAYTTHVTGMSEAAPPPPPPPAPDPVMVTFSLEKGHYLVADNGRNAATAKASVNPKIMVESNTSAVITPMFVEDANSVSVSAGSDNMPFAFVDWKLLQSEVLDTGATFMIQRAVVGANQEMEPTGDMAYVTCGPFECSESSNDGPPPAPEISIANSTVCDSFDPDVSLQVGYVDNNGDKIGAYSATAVSDYLTADTTDDARANDGVDVGWVTTSDVNMTVKHHFSGVARGQNFNVTGPGASKGTSKALAMTNRVGNTVGDSTIDDADFKGALLVGNLADTTGGIAATSACATTPYSNPIAGLHQPDSCFRVTAAGNTKSGIDYLGGYSIELAAKNSGVSWGKVAWDPNPFKDLKCESQTFMATDVIETDVCDLFNEEVDAAMAKMWGGKDGDAVTFLGGDSSTARPARATGYAALSTSASLHLVALQIEAPAAESRRFASLWYNDNDKRTDSDDESDHDLYDTPEPLHIELVDEDGDPKYGDFGKVDMAKANAAGTAHIIGEDGTAESPAGQETRCSHADGENCDGMLEETITVNFDTGLAIGCDGEREVTISCTWDASGENASYRQDDHASAVTLDTTAADGLTSTFAGFLAAPSSGRGSAGSVDAFVSCTVSSN